MRSTPTDCARSPTVAARTRWVRSGSSRYVEQTSVLKRSAISATTFLRVSAGLEECSARRTISSPVKTGWGPLTTASLSGAAASALAFKASSSVFLTVRSCGAIERDLRVLTFVARHDYDRERALYQYPMLRIQKTNNAPEKKTYYGR